MSHWVRFKHEGKTSFGTLQDEQITVHEGDLFDQPKGTSERVPLEAVELLTPTEPARRRAHDPSAV